MLQLANSVPRRPAEYISASSLFSQLLRSDPSQGKRASARSSPVVQRGRVLLSRFADAGLWEREDWTFPVNLRGPHGNRATSAGAAPMGQLPSRQPKIRDGARRVGRYGCPITMPGGRCYDCRYGTKKCDPASRRRGPQRNRRWIACCRRAKREVHRSHPGPPRSRPGKHHDGLHCL
jgi:hypothetical protein